MKQVTIPKQYKHLLMEFLIDDDNKIGSYLRSKVKCVDGITYPDKIDATIESIKKETDVNIAISKIDALKRNLKERNLNPIKLKKVPENTKEYNESGLTLYYNIVYLDDGREFLFSFYVPYK